MGLTISKAQWLNGVITFNWSFVGSAYTATQRQSNIYVIQFYIEALGQYPFFQENITLEGSGNTSKSFTGDTAILRFKVLKPNDYPNSPSIIEDFYITLDKDISYLTSTSDLSLVFLNTVAPSYSQDINGERSIKWSVNITRPTNSTILIGESVDFKIRFKRTTINGGATTYETIISRTITGSSQNFSFAFYDNKSSYDVNAIYNIFRDNEMVLYSQLFKKGTSIPISFDIGDTINNNLPPPPNTIPNTPILSLNGNYIQWTPINTSTAYNLERGGSSGSYVSIREDLQVSYDGNLQSGGTYYYRVRAKNLAGYSNYSNIVSYTVNESPTTQRYRITFSNGSYIIQDLSLEAKNYYVNLGNVATLEPNGIIGSYPAPIIPTTQRYRITFPNGSYIIQDLTIEAKNYYVNLGNIATLEPNGIIGSYPAPIIPISIPNPPIISSSVYAITDNNIVNVLISWLPVTNSTSYNIEEQSPTQNNYTSFGDSNYNDIGDGSGKIGVSVPINSGSGNYLFRVRAKNSAGYSNYSNVAVITKKISTPKPETIPDPPILTIIDSQDPLSKLLRWNQVLGLTTYNIESSSPITDPLWISFGGDFEVGELNNIGAGLWGVRVIKGIQDGLWKYRIKAKNLIGYSNYSNIVSYTIDPPDKPKPIIDNKNLLSILPKIFVMLTGLSLLGSRTK